MGNPPESKPAARSSVVQPDSQVHGLAGQHPLKTPSAPRPISAASLIAENRASPQTRSLRARPPTSNSGEPFVSRASPRTTAPLVRIADARAHGALRPAHVVLSPSVESSPARWQSRGRRRTPDMDIADARSRRCTTRARRPPRPAHLLTPNSPSVESSPVRWRSSRTLAVFADAGGLRGRARPAQENSAARAHDASSARDAQTSGSLRESRRCGRKSAGRFRSARLHARPSHRAETTTARVKRALGAESGE
ncbi:hypothetical protein B0H12DRAFT_1241582 [Mycena haematopus]|nr:hypothetical protein B0H12DRAFT_1241582 [Mycena haematopus]